MAGGLDEYPLVFFFGTPRPRKQVRVEEATGRSLDDLPQVGVVTGVMAMERSIRRYTSRLTRGASAVGSNNRWSKAPGRLCGPNREAKG